jgi:hypothetical protein
MWHAYLLAFHHLFQSWFFMMSMDSSRQDFSDETRNVIIGAIVYLGLLVILAHEECF